VAYVMKKQIKKKLQASEGMRGEVEREGKKNVTKDNGATADSGRGKKWLY